MSKPHTSSPQKDGFRMPGEFEHHVSTWMLWPERPDIWRLGGKPAQKLFSVIAKKMLKNSYPSKHDLQSTSYDFVSSHNQAINRILKVEGLCMPQSLSILPIPNEPDVNAQVCPYCDGTGIRIEIRLGTRDSKDIRKGTLVAEVEKSRKCEACNGTGKLSQAKNQPEDLK